MVQYDTFFLESNSSEYSVSLLNIYSIMNANYLRSNVKVDVYLGKKEFKKCEKVNLILNH